MAEMIAAVSQIMYMHRVKIAGTGQVNIGKPENLRLHQHAAVGGVIKFNCAAQIRILLPASDPRYGSRMVAHQKLCENGSRCYFVIGHKNHSYVF